MCLAASKGGLRWAFAEPPFHERGRAAAGRPPGGAAERRRRGARRRGARRPGPDRARAGIATDTRRYVRHARCVAHETTCDDRRVDRVARGVRVRRARPRRGERFPRVRRPSVAVRLPRRRGGGVRNHARGRGVPHRRRAFASRGGDAVRLRGGRGGGDRRAGLAVARGGGERVGFDAFRRRRRRERDGRVREGDGLRAVRVRRGGVRGSVPGGQLRQPGRRAGRDADPGPDPLPAAQRRGVSRRAGRGAGELRGDADRKENLAAGLRRGAGFARADVRAVRGRATQRHARGRDVHVPSVPGGGDHRPRIGRGGRPARARRRHRDHRVVLRVRVRGEAVRAVRAGRGRARAVRAGGARVHQRRDQRPRRRPRTRAR